MCDGVRGFISLKRVSTKKGEEMKVDKRTTEILTWDFAGMGPFEAIICDGELMKVELCAKGSDVNNHAHLIAHEGCVPFLRFVQEALNDFFKQLEGCEDNWRPKYPGGSDGR